MQKGRAEHEGTGLVSTTTLSIFLFFIILLPVFFVGALPDPGSTSLGVSLVQEQLLDWDGSNITLDGVNTGQDVMYWYRSDPVGPSGNTWVHQTQAYSFPGIVTVTGSGSTHTNQANLTESPPVVTNPTGSHLTAFHDYMGFRFKTGTDLTSLTSQEPSNITFSYDLTTFLGAPTMNAAIVGWSVSSSFSQHSLRDSSWVLGPVDLSVFGQNERVIATFSSVPLSGTIVYQFTAADLITLALIPSNSLAGISVVFFWTGSPNRVGDPFNTFDFDAAINQVVTGPVPVLQDTTVAKFRGFMWFYNIFILVPTLVFMFESVTFRSFITGVRVVVKR